LVIKPKDEIVERMDLTSEELSLIVLRKSSKLPQLRSLVASIYQYRALNKPEDMRKGQLSTVDHPRDVQEEGRTNTGHSRAIFGMLGVIKGQKTLGKEQRAIRYWNTGPVTCQESHGYTALYGLIFVDFAQKSSTGSMRMAEERGKEAEAIEARMDSSLLLSWTRCFVGESLNSKATLSAQKMRRTNIKINLRTKLGSALSAPSEMRALGVMGLLVPYHHSPRVSLVQIIQIVLL
jgi:hypothetical protein